MSNTVPEVAAGLALMVAGETRRIWLAPQADAPDKPRLMEIELLLVKPAPPPPPAPADVANAPADAVRTSSGLKTKVLRAGTGKRKPNADTLAEIEYAGWTRDGRLLDNTAQFEEPFEYPMRNDTPGLSEALSLMVEGEKRRIWVDEALGFRPQRGGPPTAVVFDVELIKIRDTPKDAHRDLKH
jgi:hypothetical protein